MEPCLVAQRSAFHYIRRVKTQISPGPKHSDTRIAAGFQSPLEKKIKESNTLRKLKALSFDSWFAKAEERYQQRYREVMEDLWKHEMFPKWEIEEEEEEEEEEKDERRQSEKTEADTRDCLVPERELNHIKKHILRTQKAWQLRADTYPALPGRVPREAPPPKARPLQRSERAGNAQRTPKASTPRQRVAWAQEQMKRHQDRMVRGRELAEKSNSQRAPGRAARAPPLPSPGARAEEVREFEWVTAYPLAQPDDDAPIQVTILREKPREEGKVKNPLPRQLLNIPPFLKSQLENNKVIF